MFGTWQIHRKANKEHFVGDVLRDTLKLVVVIEFLIDFYPMSLWIEIILVPITTFLVLFYETGKRQEGAESPTSIIGWLLTVIGIVIFGHALVSAGRDISTLFTVETVRDFAGPLVLTLLFLPYLFFVAVYVTYSNVFRRNIWAIPDPRIREFAKFHAVLAFGFNLELLRRWSRDLNNGYGESRDSIRLSIRTTIESFRREKTAIDVAYGEGWDPNRARLFLDGEGLLTDDYHTYGSEQEFWGAGSSYLDLDSEALPNNIAYYIDGDQNIARQLKIVLNVNHPQNAEHAKSRFAEVAARLSTAATGSEIPARVKRGILSQSDNVVKREGLELIVERDPFADERGFTLRFVIRKAGWTGGWSGPLRVDRERNVWS